MTRPRFMLEVSGPRPGQAGRHGGYRVEFAADSDRDAEQLAVVVRAAAQLCALRVGIDPFGSDARWRCEPAPDFEEEP